MIDKLKKLAQNILLIFYPILMMLFVLTFSGCDKEVSRSPVEPDAPEGFIYVDSEPRGFTIFLDGRNTGRLTPDSISYIAADQYLVTLKKKYFKDTSVVVFLDENEKRNVFIDIISNQSMYGDLILRTSPSGASIIINDSLINQVTPFTVQNLWPGTYQVKYDLYNYRSSSFTAIVESDTSIEYHESLRDTSVWVDYQVFNSGIQSNSLNAIAFDQNNVKWIGTTNKGLIRFDEVSFVNYNTSNSPIPTNRINCVSVDPMNRVWVGTDFGLGIFNGTSWTIYNRQNSELTSEIINRINLES